MKLPLVLAIGTAVAAIVAAFEPTGTVRGLLPFGHGVQPGSISSTGNGAQQPAEQSYAVAQATPPSTAPKRTVRGASSKVDETALRYFAAQGDQRRLEAEIARLRALYPDWTPPDNPLAVQQQGDPQLDAMWKLYAEGKLGELRKAIADRQQAEPNWQVPADLTERIALAEARDQLINASDLKQFDTVIRLGSTNPSLLTCGDVDVLWRVAEAFASTERQDRAKDAYLYVLNNCPKSEERLATVQKALPLLTRANLDQLLATEKKDADGSGEFEPIRGVIARQALAAADADPAITVAQADIDRVVALAKDGALVSDDLLLGWYFVRRDKAAEAETWFRKAHDKENTASTAQGLALALVDLQRPQEAEDILYPWRNENDDVRNVYLAAVANTLAIAPPPPLTDEVLQRMVQEVYLARDAASAQQLGWYADALNQFETAEQWFQTSLQWKPDDEPSAYGLGLMRWKLGDKAGMREVQTRWAQLSDRIATLGQPSIETAAIDENRFARPQATSRQPSTSDRGSQAAIQSQPVERPAAQQPAQRQAQADYVDRPAEPQARAPSAAQANRNSGCTATMDPARLSPQAALQRGWCLMDANRPAEAAQAFEVGLGGTGKTREDSAYGQSLAYLRLGVADKAAVAATKAPLGQGRDVEIRTALLASQATNAFEQRRYMETLIALDERARLAPERNDLMVLRGYAYMGLRRYSDAERIFRAVAGTGNRDAIKGLSDVQAATRKSSD